MAKATTQQMHRRAQKSEGAIQAALYELEISERFYLRAGLDPAGLHRKTIDAVRKALARSALNSQVPHD